MSDGGHFLHAVRNPLAAADANLRYLEDVCGDIEKLLEAIAAGESPHRGDTWRSMDPPALLREARAAIDDSCQSLARLAELLRDWSGRPR